MPNANTGPVNYPAAIVSAPQMFAVKSESSFFENSSNHSAMGSMVPNHSGMGSIVHAYGGQIYIDAQMAPGALMGPASGPSNATSTPGPSPPPSGKKLNF